MMSSNKLATSKSDPFVHAFSMSLDNVLPRYQLVGKNVARTKLVIQNLSNFAVEIGDASLTYGRGFVIPANFTYFDDIDPYTGEWFVTTNVAGPVDLRIRDEGRPIY